MSDPVSGLASVTARRSEILARIAALTSDAIVPGGTSGVFTTTGAASTTGSSSASGFAAALAQAAGTEGTDGTATEGGAVDGAAGQPATPASALPGGPVSSAWTIPWLAGSAPAAPVAEAAPVRAAAVEAAAPAAGAPGAAASGILRAGSDRDAAVDDPLAVVSPLRGRISQPFGPTTSKYSAPHTVDGVYYPHFHDGIDIAAPLGRAVKAMAAGKVVFAGTYPDGAKVVRVKHADGSIALYAHLGEGLDVEKGDRVAAGQRIGVVGMTGRSTGPHLHLELLVRGRDADPEPILERGRLPGAKDGSIDASVLGAAGVDAATTDALAAFDAVAKRIPYAAEIRAAAVRAGIDPLLLASLVKAESSFHADSVSWAGAMGLCQLMPATAKAMGVKDPFDPAQNLRAGARYLARNLHIYGRVDLALAAYQAGKGAVAAAGGIPDSPTTRHYINRILTSWARYQEAAA